jgi:hypothetical protein
MDPLTWLIGKVDSVLIAPYRWPSNPLLGWWLGTSLLALWCVLMGEITSALAYRVNRSHVKGVSQELIDRHTQSMNALRAGNKEAYKAINQLANDAYGKTFFLQIAMAASALWPVPLALSWLQSRFAGIRFPFPIALPLVGGSVTYPFIFILLYILARVLFLKGKRLSHSLNRGSES